MVFFSDYDGMISRSRFSIFLVVACYQFALVGLNVVPIGFNEVLQAFKGQASNIDFLVSFAMTGAMSASLLILAIPAGFIVNSLSHKKVFLFSLFFLSLSGFVGYFSTNIYIFLLGRLIFGISFLLGDMMFSVLILENSKNSADGARNFSLGNAQNMLGNIIYTFAAGFLPAQKWRLPHAILACSALLLPICFKIIPESKKSLQKKSANKGYGALKKVDPIKTTMFLFIHIGILTGLGFVAIATPSITQGMKNADRLNGIFISAMWLGAAISSSLYRKVLKNPNPLNAYFIGAMAYCFGLMTLIGTTNAIIPLTFVKYLIIGAGIGLVFSNAFLLLLDIVRIKQTSLVSSCISFSLGVGYILSPIFKMAIKNESGGFYRISALSFLPIMAMLIFLRQKHKASS